MAWADFFNNPIQAPNANTGDVPLTGSLTDIGIAAGTLYFPSGFVINPTAAAVPFQIQDSAGKDLVPAGAAPGDTEIPAGGRWPVPDDWFLLGIPTPIKAKGNGLHLRITGYLIALALLLLLPGSARAQIVAQGPAASTSDTAAWPTKTVFGGVQIDPRSIRTLTVSDNVTVTPAGATSWAVTGTFWPTTAGAPSAVRLSNGTSFIDPTQIRALTSSDQVTIANASIAVTGTFWQATQPVSGTVTANAGSGTFTVSGTVTANAGSGTFTNQQSNITTDYDTGAGTQTMTMFGVALPANGGAVAGGTSTNPLQVSLANTGANATAVKVDGSAVTQPVSGTVTVQQATAANLKVDLSGTGANATAIKVDGSGVTQPVSGTITANAGSGTFTVGGTVTANQGTANATPWNDNVAQIAGTSTATGNGTTTAGTQRVTLSSDSTGQVALAAGTNAIGTVTSQWVAPAKSTAAWTSATTLNTALTISSLGNLASITIALNATSTMTGGTLNFEADEGSLTWWALECVREGGASTTGAVDTTFALSVTNQVWQCDVPPGMTSVRVRLNPVITGSGTANLSVMPSAAATEPIVTVQQPTASMLNTTDNVAQFGGSNVVTGTGAGGAGIPRVTVSNDSTVTSNQGTANATPWNENIAQFGGSAVVTGLGPNGSGVPRVTMSDDDTVGSVTINATTACPAASTTPQTSAGCIVIPMAGRHGATVQLINANLSATIIIESSIDGGTTFAAALVSNGGTNVAASGIVFGTDSTTQLYNLMAQEGISHLRVRASVLTGGSTAATIRATKAISPLAVGALNVFLTGAATPAAVYTASVGGFDASSKPSPLSVLSATFPTGNERATITRDLTATVQNCRLTSLGTTLTQCAALSSGLKIYVVGAMYASTTGTASTVQLKYGTGSNCGTGTTILAPGAVWATPINTAEATVKDFGNKPLVVPASNALCALGGSATNTTDILVMFYQAP